MERGRYIARVLGCRELEKGGGGAHREGFRLYSVGEREGFRL